MCGNSTRTVFIEHWRAVHINKKHAIKYIGKKMQWNRMSKSKRQTCQINSIAVWSRVVKRNFWIYKPVKKKEPDFHGVSIPPIVFNLFGAAFNSQETDFLLLEGSGAVAAAGSDNMFWRCRGRWLRGPPPRPKLSDMTLAYCMAGALFARPTDMRLSSHGLFVPALGCNSRAGDSECVCVWRLKTLAVLTDRGEETQPCV